jgi:nucleoside-diphosphate-sugar epimerase
MRIVVTGGSGFVGRALAKRLAANGHDVVLPLRDASAAPGAVPIKPIEEMTAGDWRPVLAGADAVVHCAAIAHIGPSVPYNAYAAVNRDAVARLADATAAAGATRFVFLSSIRAQCGATSDAVQSEKTRPEPTEGYGRSKLQAEALILKALPRAVILRPALIVGRDPKGNLATLLKFAKFGLPLPFGNLNAPQAMVALEALIEAILLALTNDAMRGETYCVAQDPHLSLSCILKEMRRGMGRSPGLLPCPPALLAFPLKLIGRGEMAARLTSGLKVDAAKLRAAGWKPALGLATALKGIGAAAAGR